MKERDREKERKGRGKKEERKAPRHKGCNAVYEMYFGSGTFYPVHFYTVKKSGTFLCIP